MNDVEISIGAISHNGAPRSRPRKPLVHILVTDQYGSVHSIAFQPDDAPEICEAIQRAAKAAREGRKRKPIVIHVDAA